jgi:hypothetical protein
MPAFSGAVARILGVSSRWLTGGVGPSRQVMVSPERSPDLTMTTRCCSGGTLRLSIDNVGLDYTVDLPSSRSDVWELVERRDVSGSSFAFECWQDDWGYSDGVVRTLLSARLRDVSPVVNAAYPDATVSLRSLARQMGAPIDDVLRYSEAGELVKFFRRSDRSSRPMSARQRQLEVMARRWTTPQPSAPVSARQRQLEVMARRWTTPQPSGTRSGRQALVELLGKRFPPQ